MHTLGDIHLQFAEAFDEPAIRPLAYLLSKKLQEGNICIKESDFEEIPKTLLREEHYRLEIKKWPTLISTDAKANVPFIKQDDRFYFQRYFRYEHNIIEKLKSMMMRSIRSRDARMQKLAACADIFPLLSATYPLEADLSEAERVDWQLIAAIQAQLYDFFIITGGPGTGKTTTLAKLLRILLTLEPESNIALAAPTGKASMRMYESLRKSTTDFSAMFTDEIKERIAHLPNSTLHKLLGYKPNSIYFKHNEQNPLEYDVVIVDEASMIDVPMFSKLLNALKPGAKLILLGDKDQLASVEAGSLLGDLCKTAEPFNQYTPEMAQWINGCINDKGRHIPEAFISSPTPLGQHIVELKLSHRFRSQGLIGKLSKGVIQNDAALIDTVLKESSSDLIFDQAHAKDVLANFATHYETYIDEPDIAKALKALNEVRVLTAVRQGDQGLYTLNKKIEQILESRKKIILNKTFYHNRPIIITRNNYDLDLFNGDIGIVRADEDGQLRVWFEGENGKLRSILPAYISDCETVFAMTIHKSQGSEFSKVMVILPSGKNNPLLTRELLYTGITRTKQKGTLVVSGSLETIAHTMGSVVNRISGIGENLSNVTF